MDEITRLPINDRAVPGDNSKVEQIELVPIADLAIWSASNDLLADLTEDDIAQEVQILEVSGQRSVIIARPLDNGRIEVITMAKVVAAYRICREVNPERFANARVRIIPDLTNTDAARFLAQEFETGAQPSSYARGCFYKKILKDFKTEQDLAKACRISKSAVSKNLDVARAADALADKVEIRRDIGQRDAGWLMQTIGRSKDGSDDADAEIRSRLLNAIKEADRQPARKLFPLLRKAACGDSEEPTRNRRVLTEGDIEFGYVKLTGGKPRRIELTNIGDLNPDQIGKGIATIIAALRSEQ